MLILCMPGITEPACTICTLSPTTTTTNFVSQPSLLAFSPTNFCLAVANFGSGVVSTYIVTDSCNLTFAGTITTGSGAGSGPTSLAFSPDGTCIAVANFNDNTISMFTIDAFCELTLSETTSSGGTGPTSVAFSPNGQCLAVTNESTPNVTIFQVSSCSLSSANSYTTGSSPQALAFSLDGNCVFTADFGSSTISSFAVTPSCTLIPIAVGTISSGGTGPIALAFSPNGCLAVANQTSGDVALFSFSSPTCSINQIGSSVSAGTSPTSVAFSPSGLCLAVSNFVSSGTVTMFNVDPLTCALTTATGSPFAAGNQTTTAEFSPNGDCLAAGNYTSNSISMFNASSSLPQVSISAFPTTICDGHSSLLTATILGGIPNFTYTFNAFPPIVLDSRTATMSVSPTSTTNYSVSITDGDGCTATSSTITVTVDNPVVTLAANPPLVCFGNSSILTATVTGGTAPYTYHFSDGFTTTTPATSVNHSVIPSATTNYTVTVTDGNGCTGTSNISTVTVDNPSASLSASPSLVCIGNSSTLTASVAEGTAPYIYLFSDGFSETTSATTLNHTVTPSATTNYTVTITDANNCTCTSGVSTVTVDNPLATLSASPTVICAGNSSTLTASISAGTAPYTYVFSDGFTTGPTPNPSITHVVSPSTTTNYTVTITDANGCIATSNETTVTLDILSVAITPAFQGVTKGSTITLTAMPSAGIPPFSFAWQTPGRGAFSGQSISLPNATISDIGTYMLTMTDSNGCQASNSAKVVITPSGNGSNPNQSLVLISNTSSATITGTGTPGSTISLFVTDPFVGTTVVDSAGNFSFTLPPLPNGRYTITLSSTFDGITVSSSFTLIIRANQSTLSSLITAKYNCST